MKTLFASDRKFALWSFNASHRQLILRSNPDRIARTVTRVEVYFGHVEFMSIRPSYSSLRISEADQGEITEIAARIPDGLRPGGTYLLGRDLRSFVISAKPAWREAECDFDAPSLFDFPA
ncbi:MULTISPECIES: hypothetical protein [Streptomyces]|uniref:hypothetical protein n=1 Tax=Streptomyces TaxID=1883 RepID=UPI00081B7468|nr:MULTISPECIES: hypothetical protein [Streptomyces]MBT3072847.1 hypothetical protein [Streptomyces sp. COG21]MBT3081258.1 hypothetical protein [Streptomyces sp. COG20]MBT3089869.1 hypothetical protein [Streptomyces sp. CYG21]MBT3097607.1 hypothetical protein [Streptomyces sp. CBG30]MBT3102844.1 hypothetical protein [Streptomyces sp. COG19]